MSSQDWTPRPYTTSLKWTSDLLPSLAPARPLGSGPQTSSPPSPLHDLSGVDLRPPPLLRPCGSGPQISSPPSPLREWTSDLLPSLAPAQPLGSGPQTSSPPSPLHDPSPPSSLHDLSGVDLRPPPLPRPCTTSREWTSDLLPSLPPARPVGSGPQAFNA